MHYYIFTFQQGRKNPNVTEALALSSDNTAEDINYERYNVMVHDFVQKLPGVTSKNIARIMNKGISLDHFITLTKVSFILNLYYDTYIIYYCG